MIGPGGNAGAFLHCGALEIGRSILHLKVDRKFLMRISGIIAFCIILMGQAAFAEPLSVLATKSAFLSQHIKYLKSKKARSVITSTKPYCPSNYWWSARSASDSRAKSGYQKQITREMTQSGFPKSAIAHCVNSGAFLLNAGSLQPHPKNTEYRKFVTSGSIVFSKKGASEISSIPALIETYTYSDRSWAVYDSRFKKICTIRDGKTKKHVSVNCGNFGQLTGTYLQENGRSLLALNNNKYEVLMITNRTPSYALNTFKKTFR